MGAPEVHESWGHPRRVAHAYEVHTFSWWKLAMLWGIITSIAGHIWLVSMAGQLMGAW